MENTRSSRVDAIALAVGARVGVSTLMLACVLAIVMGASSMLSSLQGMDRDLKQMSGELDTAQASMDQLNVIMDSVPPTADHMSAIVKTVQATGTEVKTSAGAINALNSSTSRLNGMLATIAQKTGDMSASLTSVDTKTGTLSTTVGNLNERLGPMVATQHEMLGEVQNMQGGMSGMNGSLAYVIRVLNYMSEPPTGQGFMVRADLPKEALPPIPGVHVKTDPVTVFPRGAWRRYTGP